MYNLPSMSQCTYHQIHHMVLQQITGVRIYEPNKELTLNCMDTLRMYLLHVQLFLHDIIILTL